MSKPIESFFDEDAREGYRLWHTPSGPVEISQEDIIFQAPLCQTTKRSNKWKERYLVLTADYLYLLHSEEEPRMLSMMKTEWVRVDFIKSKTMDEKVTHFCIRFVRNMVYTDLWTDDEEHFNAWYSHLARVFLQCDFHTKFNTIKMIGKGSFARVYLVENKENKQRFAVKAFSKEYLLSQPKGKASLINEIQVMQKLQHPYIMNLEEVHESKNSIYLVLELLEGGELLNYISSKQNLGLRDYWRVMKCILEALAYMDEKKIMHRDLKPDNMILKENSQLQHCTLKLVDFGLATVYDVPEYLFKRCGTPGFVAPEVINAPSNSNIHYTPKCDVFSAGIIFYILITEKSPFDGKSFKEILQKNKSCKIDFNHPKIKKNKIITDLLIKMLATNPEERISAAEALQHRFFADFDDHEMIIEKPNPTNIQMYTDLYKKQARNMPNNLMGETHSLVIKQAVIDGRTNTMHDSVNSQGVICSFKSMSSPKKVEGNQAKRESILKFVLMQSTQNNSGNIYGSNFAPEFFESDDEA